MRAVRQARDAGRMMADVDVIVVTYNSEPWVDRLLPTIGDARAIVVDNASTDGTLAALKQHDVTAWANHENRYLSAAWVQALAASRAPYVALVNPDSEILTPGWADKATAYFEEHPDVGVIGPRVFNADGSVQHTVWPARSKRWALARALSLPSHPDPPEPDSVQDVDVVSGCFLILRRQMLDAIGGIDPRYRLYWEENDICLRAKRAGWRVVYNPDVEVMHASAASISQRDPSEINRMFAESRDYYFAKNHGRVFGTVLRMLYRLRSAGGFLKRLV